MAKGTYFARLLAVAAGLSLLAPAAALAVGRASPTDWPSFLDGPMHWSYAASQKAITPGTAKGLVQKWHFLGPAGHQPGQPPPDYYASPTVADGAVFIGSNTGWFYKLNEKTGAVEAKAFIGYQPRLTCYPMGIVDTATVAADPATHKETVYVGGPDGYLYAFNAANLTLKWKSTIAIPSKKVNDYFEWSSPTVTGGKIYIGASSNCDNPLIRGGVFGYRQTTGKRFAAFYTVPKHQVGGSVWATVAVTPNGDVYAATGNGPLNSQELAYSQSIIRLTPDLKLLNSWKVPVGQHAVDGDFGASPTIFGRYVGDCNKDGIYYALDRYSLKLIWEARVGAFVKASVLAICTGSAAYNGRDLFIGSTGVKIHGKNYRGSIQERTAGGKLVWQTGLPEGVTGTPTIDGGGIVAVGTFDNGTAPNATYLINASNGHIISAFVKGLDFAQSTFANGWLFTANAFGVFAWAPS